MPTLPGSHSSSDWCLHILHIHSMTSCSAQMLQLNAKQGKGWNVVQTPNIVKFDQTIKHWIHPSVLDWELTTFYSCLLFSLVRDPPKKVVHNNHEGVHSWLREAFLQSTFLQFSLCCKQQFKHQAFAKLEHFRSLSLSLLKPQDFTKTCQTSICNICAPSLIGRMAKPLEDLLQRTELSSFAFFDGGLWP